MLYFVKFENLTANFCSFYCFLFISQPAFNQFEWKLYQNLAKYRGYITTDQLQLKLILIIYLRGLYFAINIVLFYYFSAC